MSKSLDKDGGSNGREGDRGNFFIGSTAWSQVLTQAQKKGEWQKEGSNRGRAEINHWKNIEISGGVSLDKIKIK